MKQKKLIEPKELKVVNDEILIFENKNKKDLTAFVYSSYDSRKQEVKIKKKDKASCYFNRSNRMGLVYVYFSDGSQESAIKSVSYDKRLDRLKAPIITRLIRESDNLLIVRVKNPNDFQVVLKINNLTYNIDKGCEITTRMLVNAFKGTIQAKFIKSGYLDSEITKGEYGGL